MSVATLPSEPTKPAAVAGRAEVGFKAAGGTTRLAHLYQREPLRVLFPRTPEDLPTATLVNTAGGLVGGDALTVKGAVGEGARAVVMAQAAEKVYRSTGADCRIEAELSVAEGGYLEWLPQETILHDGARLRRRTRLHLAEGAKALAGEMLVFGRLAHGEAIATGLARDAWEVSVGGRLAWAEAVHMDGDLRSLLDAPATFGGAAAVATMIVVGHPGLDELRDRLRALSWPAGARAGITVVGPVLVARWQAADPLAVRQAFAQGWTRARNVVAGLPGRMPRLWEI